jgi:hypothetical protein
VTSPDERAGELLDRAAQHEWDRDTDTQPEDTESRQEETS